MTNPAGEAQNDTLRVDFDRRVTMQWLAAPENLCALAERPTIMGFETKTTADLRRMGVKAESAPNGARNRVAGTKSGRAERRTPPLGLGGGNQSSKVSLIWGMSAYDADRANGICGHAPSSPLDIPVFSLHYTRSKGRSPR